VIYVARADCFELLHGQKEVADLIVADPWYGGVAGPDDLAEYQRVAKAISDWLRPGGTAFVWGGIGKPKKRAFFRFLASVEEETDLTLWDGITWKKKRAYGKQDRLLFVREEIAMLVKGDRPAHFKPPYLDKLRGYAGYSKKYPAKDARLRVTNVWDDITELLRGKIHPCEKPWQLAARMIEMSSKKDMFVLDPFAGSGSTGVAVQNVGGRDALLIEKTSCAMRSFDFEAVTSWPEAR
jgi:DNA modification methylase